MTARTIPPDTLGGAADDSVERGDSQSAKGLYQPRATPQPAQDGLLFDPLPLDEITLELPFTGYCEFERGWSWSRPHKCTPQCKDGTHVFELEVPPSVAELFRPLSSDELRLYALITRMVWLVITPDEEKELLDLLSRTPAPI